MSVGRGLGVDEPVERPQALIDHRLRFEDPAGDDQRAREQGVLVGHQRVRPRPVGRRVATGTARAGGWREASSVGRRQAARTLSRRPPRSPGRRTPRRGARRARGPPAAPGRTERPRRRPARHRGRSRSCRPARASPGRSCRRSRGRRSTSRRSSGSSGSGRSARRRRRRGSGILARRSASTAAQPSTFAVEQVDLERPGDVVDAVAVRRVRPRPDRVLHDPDAVGQDVEMVPAHRDRAARGQTPTAVRSGRGTASQRFGAGDGREEIAILGPDGRPDHPTAVGVGPAADRRPQGGIARGAR